MRSGLGRYATTATDDYREMHRRVCAFFRDLQQVRRGRGAGRGAVRHELTSTGNATRLLHPGSAAWTSCASAFAERRKRSGAKRPRSGSACASCRPGSGRSSSKVRGECAALLTRVVCVAEARSDFVVRAGPVCARSAQLRQAQMMVVEADIRRLEAMLRIQRLEQGWSTPRRVG